MEKLILEKAKSLGFPSQLSEENYWQILPIQRGETWKLTAAESRWILSLRNVPQLRLNHDEAIAFLAFQANTK